EVRSRELLSGESEYPAGSLVYFAFAEEYRSRTFTSKASPCFAVTRYTVCGGGSSCVSNLVPPCAACCSACVQVRPAPPDSSNNCARPAPQRLSQAAACSSLNCSAFGPISIPSSGCGLNRTVNSSSDSFALLECSVKKFGLSSCAGISISFPAETRLSPPC